MRGRERRVDVLMFEGTEGKCFEFKCCSTVLRCYKLYSFLISSVTHHALSSPLASSCLLSSPRQSSNQITSPPPLLTPSIFSRSISCPPIHPLMQYQHPIQYSQLHSTYFVRMTSNGYAANNAVPPAKPPADRLHANTLQNYRLKKEKEKNR